MKFLVINGPNLDMLGKREPNIYGSETLDQIIDYTKKTLEVHASSLNNSIKIDWFQSNSEGDLVSKIGLSCSEKYDGLIINPAAYTHTSVAIYDALKIVSCPIVEVHLSNTNSREDIRKNKLTTASANIVIEGAGKNVYSLAIISLLLTQNKIKDK